MDIKLAYKWIQEYVKTDLKADDFARKLSLHGPSIERWHYDEDLEDFVLSIEATNNRVDIASVIGIAREATSILRTDFLWKRAKPNLSIKKILPLNVNIHNFERCSRFQSIVIDGITVKDSPEWMQKRLKASGINSINNIVDITNYVLLEYGQPMHAYDYNKIDGHEINIRLAIFGEKILTLGSTNDSELTSSDLVVCDSNSPMSIAGVKGGGKSAITSFTKTIALEAANFEPTSTRKSARKHNLQTDASSLFEKGLPSELTEDAIYRAIELVLELAGGEVASELVDKKITNHVFSDIKYPYSLTKKILGVDVDKSEIVDILERLGFKCIDLGEYLQVKVPYYRALDVQFDYDLTEEIARIYGYHKIPNLLPVGSIPVVKTPSIITNEDRFRDIMVDNGFIEMFSYSMVSAKHLKIANIESSDVINILNPLTNDYLYMRNEMSSNALIVSANNQTFKDKLKLFEISNIYLKTSETDLPKEQSTLVILSNGTNYKEIFYELKGLWELILKNFGIDLNDIKYMNEIIGEPYFTGRSANIYFKGDFIGKIGLASKKAQASASLKKENVLLEVNFEKLSEIIDNSTKSYKGIPKYPLVNRDLAFILDSSIEWKMIQDVIIKEAGEFYLASDLFDVFESNKLGLNKKSIAFHLTLQSENKTLEEFEVNEIVDRITASIVSNFNSVIRS